MPKVEFRWLPKKTVEGSQMWVVQTDAGSMAFGAFDGKRIFVHYVESKRKGDFKAMMNKLVETLGTNHIVFCQVTSLDLIEALCKRPDKIAEVEFYEHEEEGVNIIWMCIHVLWDYEPRSRA